MRGTLPTCRLVASPVRSDLYLATRVAFEVTVDIQGVNALPENSITTIAGLVESDWFWMVGIQSHRAVPPKSRMLDLIPSSPSWDCSWLCI
jgi:hypothetical protein